MLAFNPTDVTVRADGRLHHSVGSCKRGDKERRGSKVSTLPCQQGFISRETKGEPLIYPAERKERREEGGGREGGNRKERGRGGEEKTARNYPERSSSISVQK